MYLDIQHIRPGMYTAEDVVKDHVVLIEAGTLLTERHLSRLDNWGIDRVKVLI